MSTDRRLENLEQLVRALAREVEALRAEVRGVSPRPTAATDPVAPAAPAHPPALGAAESRPPARPSDTRAPRPPAVARRSKAPPFDLERFLGRYGTMALAVLTIVAGVGTFLGWAVAHVRLGPEARVALGAVAAVALTVAGWRVMLRGHRRFAHLLLGLALALVHVDAWGAGPKLELIPEWAALTIAAGASAALAIVALRLNAEALFSVGMGGALLAPFVMSQGRGEIVPLLGFGAIVLTAAAAAIRGRTWGVAVKLMVIGCGMYAAAGLAGAGDVWPRRDAPLLFALVVGWGAVILGGPLHRIVLARAQLGLAVLVAFAAALAEQTGAASIALVAAGALTAYAAPLAAPGGERAAPLLSVLFPLAFLIAGLMMVERAVSPAGAALAAGFTGIAATTALFTRDAPRDEHWLTAGVTGLVAIYLGLARQPVPCIVALAAYSCALAALARAQRSLLVLIPAAGALAVAVAWAFVLLEQRPDFTYPPLLTRESFAALVSVVACGLFGPLLVATLGAVEPSRSSGPSDEGGVGELLNALGAIALFFWVREELSEAFSPDLRTFLLISYYAAAGVSVLLFGRWRGRNGARRVGLALAMLGALKALVEAVGLDAIGLRVGSFLLVGAFMLLVNYWYWSRAPQSGDTQPVAE